MPCVNVLLPSTARLLGAMAALVMSLMLTGTVASATQSDAAFAETLTQLTTNNFKAKQEAATALAAIRHDGTRPALEALLDGRLYYRRDDKRVFIATEDASGLALIDPVSSLPAGTGASDDFARIATNNQLRKALKSLIAGFDLANPSAAVRLTAVNEMLRSMDDAGAVALRAQYEKETDDSVRDAIRVGLAIVDLDSDDAEVRLTAVNALSHSLNADAYNRLKALTNLNDDGTPIEPDARVRSAAAKAVRSIDSSRSIYGAVETLFFGLSLGSVLVLAAIGLAITFGVMGVINMAHGELIMLGAYTTYVIQLVMPNHIGLSVLIAVPVAFAVSGGVGILIERGVVRFLYGRPLETLLATFGVSLILQQVVRDVFTANNRPVETPAWMAGSLQVNEALSITYNRLYVVLFMLIVFVTLLVVLKRTTLGLKVRAVAQNRAMAKAMGVRTEWLDAMTFGLGSGIAGVAGVALSQLTNVGPNLGQSYIIDSFMVVVFGGVGNLWGTLIGGMSLGVVNQLLEPFAGAVLAKILVLISLILFIQRRPRGLFPQKGRAAES